MNNEKLEKEIISIIERIETHASTDYDICDFDKKAFLSDILKACEKFKKGRVDSDAYICDYCNENGDDCPCSE